MTPHDKTRQKVTLYRGVYPMAFSYEGMDSDDVVPNMIAELKRKGAVQDGDKVLVTRGKHRGIMGGTNVLLIVEVGK
jgi:pyruvate kinase